MLVHLVCPLASNITWTDEDCSFGLIAIYGTSMIRCCCAATCGPSMFVPGASGESGKIERER